MTPCHPAAGIKIAVLRRLRRERRYRRRRHLNTSSLFVRLVSGTERLVRDEGVTPQHRSPEQTSLSTERNAVIIHLALSVFFVLLLFPTLTSFFTSLI